MDIAYENQPLILELETPADFTGYSDVKVSYWDNDDYGNETPTGEFTTGITVTPTKFKTAISLAISSNVLKTGNWKFVPEIDMGSGFIPGDQVTLKVYKKGHIL